VKDIPNTAFKHSTNRLNDNKPIPSSRNTQEVFNSVAQEMLGIYREHKYTTSILDDFYYFNHKETMKKELISEKSLYNDNSETIKTYIIACILEATNLFCKLVYIMYILINSFI
jgi:hypothetical protein